MFGTVKKSPKVARNDRGPLSARGPEKSSEKLPSFHGDSDDEDNSDLFSFPAKVSLLFFVFGPNFDYIAYLRSLVDR